MARQTKKSLIFLFFVYSDITAKGEEKLTKQEMYTCDICFDQFMVPLNGSVHMTLICNGKEQFNGDLCPDCHEALVELQENLRKKKHE